MTIASESRPKKKLPYWAVVLIGVIVTAIVANFLMSIFLVGGFTSWTALPKPPSQIIHVVHADTNNVWVETTDAQKFKLLLNCYNNKSCYQWTKVDDVPKPIDSYSGLSLDKGTDCTSLNKNRFPTAPFGKVIECLKVVEIGAEYGFVIYFALMADGTLQYWANGSNAIAAELLPVFTIFVLPFFVAIMISVLYLINRVLC